MSDSENLDEVVEINDSELIIEEGKKRKLSIDTDEVLASGPDKKCREGMVMFSLLQLCKYLLLVSFNSRTMRA